jgi:hypothetical protein
VSKSTADNFYISFKINETYTNKNQYTTYNNLDLLFDTPPKSDRKLAYQSPIGQKNKKNRQKEWDQFNK